MKSDDINTYTMKYYEENELFWGPVCLYLGGIFKNGPNKDFKRLSTTNFTWSILEYFILFESKSSK